MIKAPLVPWQPVLYCLLFALEVVAAVSPFKAHVSDSTVVVGDSLTLMLELVGTTRERPDLIELERNFDIISQSTSTQTEFVNGRQFAKTTWTLEIAAKEDSPVLTIPAIRLGQYYSKPIIISQTSGTKKSSNDALIISASLDSSSAYINGQVILSINLKTRLTLQNGTIDKPEIEDAIIESISEDDNREVFENGVKYYTFKKYYAVFFSTPGTKTIKPIKFEGMVHAPRKGRAWGGFFSSGQRIRAQTKELSIVIKGVPPSYPKNQPFLPLKNFVVVESFDNADPKFEVSKAVARRFELKAMGTLPSFLPVIKAPSIENLQIYAEPGNKSQESNINGIKASNSFSHVYMPLAPGKITIPKRLIYWWDTQEDELKSIEIRELDIDVQGGALPVVKKNDEEVAKQAVESNELGENEKNNIWPFISLALLILWVTTLVYFLKSKKHSDSISDKKASEDNIVKPLVDQVISACDERNAKKVLHAVQILKKGLLEKGMKNKFSDNFNSNIISFEASLYKGAKPQIDEKEFDVIKTEVKLLASPPKHEKGLPPLYPT